MIELSLRWQTCAWRHHLRHPFHRVHHWLLRHWLHNGLHHWILWYHHYWLRKHHRLHHWLHHRIHHWLLSHHHWWLLSHHHWFHHRLLSLHHRLLIHHLRLLIHNLRLLSHHHWFHHRFVYQDHVNSPCTFTFVCYGIPLINVLFHKYFIELDSIAAYIVFTKHVLVPYCYINFSLIEDIEIKSLIPRWLLSTTLMNLCLFQFISTLQPDKWIHRAKNFCVSC